MDHLLPQRIVCLTEETTEWLYMLGEEARIVGISGYTVRPRCAREEKPKVSAFLSAKIDQILALEPDCVFGFSDLQADIAALLIRAGVQVTVFNQRSVDEIFAMLYQVAAMVGQAEQGIADCAAYDIGSERRHGSVLTEIVRRDGFERRGMPTRGRGIAATGNVVGLHGVQIVSAHQRTTRHMLKHESLQTRQ